MKAKVITVRVPENINLKLEFLSSLLGENKSEITRKALSIGLSEIEKEVKKRLGD